MNWNEVFEFDRRELVDISLIVLTLSFLFSMTFYHFTDTFGFIPSLLVFLVFFVIIFLARLAVMKMIGYSNAFHIYLRQNHFDRYWIRPWDKFSYYVGDDSFKGFPMSFIAIFLYVMTLGMLIFPILWNFEHKKIPHKLLGNRKKFENLNPTMQNIDISDFRLAKTFFAGFMYYFFAALVLKLFSTVTGEYYWWFMFSIFWIALLTLIPIPSSDGYELWIRNRPLWLAAVVSMIAGLFAMIIFKSIWLVLIVVVMVTLLALFMMHWKSWVK